MGEYFTKPIVKVLMLKGQRGQGIKSITKTDTSGLVDTYTIMLTDGTISTFTVKNGKDGDGLQNLQVGGRNLLIGTNKGINNLIINGYNAKYNSIPKTFEELGNVLGARFEIVKPSSSWSYIMYKCQELKDIIFNSTGETFTVSFDFRTDHDGTIEVLLQTNGGENQLVNFGNANVSSKKWNNIKLTSTALKNVLADQGLFISIDKLQQNATYIEIANLKVERGNIATDWTPAPEDLTDTAITNSEIDTIVG